uniref:LOW QUALITY PROTEIN: uncharacterized protein C4orf3 homolog n=1 Tax=Odobenus rosmarus divergens TaxID=9708 RepID=UPI00063CA73E|nr:PREDICTED: LOW QUALITY PROTEIN: uncharacterized protein C4orf3 homolog [Odobenus rosmarus divergens]
MTSPGDSLINRWLLYNAEGQILHCLDLEVITLSPRRKLGVQIGRDKLNVKFSQLRNLSNQLTPLPRTGRTACRLSRRQRTSRQRLRAGRRGQRARFRGQVNAEVQDVRVCWVLRPWWGDWCEMEEGAAAEDGRDGVRERLGLGEAGRQQQNHEVRSQSRADRFPKHSYWLDLWLFILLDVALFIFVYLLPWSEQLVFNQKGHTPKAATKSPSEASPVI